MRDHIERGNLSPGRCAVVLDEADEMLDMGFREELEAILDAVPAERRTLLFSATVPRPIAALAKRYQRDALRIEARRGAQHRDIEYRALLIAPHETERAVVNALRFFDAPRTWCSAAPAPPCRACTATWRSGASRPWRCPAS
jgi:ATP-dependent RNA helicase DeaD